MANRETATQQRRERRALRTRATLFGTAIRPRLSVFRSLRFTYAQLIDDAAGVTLWAGSTIGIKGAKGKTAAAEKLGALAADGAKAKKIDAVVFDRGAYRYHGRVKAVAEGARKAGLKF